MIPASELWTKWSTKKCSLMIHSESVKCFSFLHTRHHSWNQKRFPHIQTIHTPTLLLFLKVLKQQIPNQKLSKGALAVVKYKAPTGAAERCAVPRNHRIVAASTRCAWWGCIGLRTELGEQVAFAALRSFGSRTASCGSPSVAPAAREQKPRFSNFIRPRTAGPMKTFCVTMWRVCVCLGMLCFEAMFRKKTACSPRCPGWSCMVQPRAVHARAHRHTGF